MHSWALGIHGRVVCKNCVIIVSPPLTSRLSGGPVESRVSTVYSLHAKRAGKEFSFCLETVQVDTRKYPKSLTVLHLKIKRKCSQVHSNFKPGWKLLQRFAQAAKLTAGPSVLTQQYAASECSWWNQSSHKWGEPQSIPSFWFFSIFSSRHLKILYILAVITAIPQTFNSIL